MNTLIIGNSFTEKLFRASGMLITSPILWRCLVLHIGTGKGIYFYNADTCEYLEVYH